MNSPSTTPTLTINLEPQPEGVYTVTCNELPELVTEGSTIKEILDNIEEAFSVVVGLYESTGRQLPFALNTEQNTKSKSITLTTFIPPYEIPQSGPKAEEARL